VAVDRHGTFKNQRFAGPARTEARPGKVLIQAHENDPSRN
jgi:hypothetical protein